MKCTKIVSKSHKSIRIHKQNLKARPVWRLYKQFTLHGNVSGDCGTRDSFPERRHVLTTRRSQSEWLCGIRAPQNAYKPRAHSALGHCVQYIRHATNLSTTHTLPIVLIRNTTLHFTLVGSCFFQQGSHLHTQTTTKC